MSNSYTKASFVLEVTASEAVALRAAKDAAAIAADDTTDQAETERQYAALPEAFRLRFPPTDANPLSGFLAIFNDPSFPCLQTTIRIEADEAGRHRAHFSGDQFDVDEIAALIHRLCPSALPCGFEWSRDCDKLRAGEFGSGYVAITSEGPRLITTSEALQAALRPRDNEDGDRFALSARDTAHGRCRHLVVGGCAGRRTRRRTDRRPRQMESRLQELDRSAHPRRTAARRHRRPLSRGHLRQRGD